MSDQQENSGTGSVSSSESCEHRDDEWPFRSHFRKKYQPYGVRVCEETIEEIRSYDDCSVIQGSDFEGDPIYWVEIQTREGTLEANYGDWIMEDSEGHHYPIADEEIRQTYEPVNED